MPLHPAAPRSGSPKTLASLLLAAWMNRIARTRPKAAESSDATA
jgi:hypothetical protein